MSRNEKFTTLYLSAHKLLDYTSAVGHFSQSFAVGTAKRTEDLLVEDAVTDFNQRKKL